MNVYIHMGSMKFVEKSGVGRAIFHQKKLLEDKGVSVNRVSVFKSDIAHFNTVFPDAVITALLAKASGRKIVYYGHSTMEDFKNSFKGSNFFAPLFKQWIRFCYSLGDVIITPSEYSKRLIESYKVSKPVEALSNGIDLEFWGQNDDERKKFRKKYKIEDDRKVVISVGHYIERKGIVEFIELAKQMPDITFIWFGYTNLNLVPREISEAIKGASKNIIFPGYVSREELREAYHGCDAFCFMSHEETEGIVILEALASKAPTIVRDIPVYESWLSDHRDVIKCRNNPEFMAAIKEVLSSDNTKMIEEGLKNAGDRSYDRIGTALLNIYSKYCLNEKQTEKAFKKKQARAVQKK